MSRSKLTIRLLVTTLACSLVPAPILGQTSPTAAVNYSDLDLGRNEGVATLNARVMRAAESVCAGHRTIGPPAAAIPNFHNCVRSALANARPQLQQVIAQASRPQLADRTPIRVNGR